MFCTQLNIVLFHPFTYLRGEKIHVGNNVKKTLVKSGAGWCTLCWDESSSRGGSAEQDGGSGLHGELVIYET